MYLEIDEGFVGHRKTIRFCGLMQSPEAGIYLIRLWTWACRSAPDGDMTGMAAYDVEIAVGYRLLDGKCYAALVEARFIDVADDGTQTIHNWGKRTGGAILKMDAAAASKRRHREHKARVLKKEACPVDCEFHKREQDPPKPPASMDSPRTVEGQSDGRPLDIPTKTRPVQTRPVQTRPVEEETHPPRDPSATEPEPEGERDEPEPAPAKEPSYPAEFERIWAGTGRKGNKWPAFAAWKRLGRPSAEFVLAGWQAWMRTDQWRRGFVPHLSTWLNARGWEDVPTAADLAGAAAPTKATGPPRDPAECEYHANGRNKGRAASAHWSRPLCPECKHMAARNRPRGEAQDPATLRDVIAAGWPTKPTEGDRP
jgi:hypothetical protein